MRKEDYRKPGARKMEQQKAHAAPANMKIVEKLTAKNQCRRTMEP